jgi:hypothetical protein
MPFLTGLTSTLKIKKMEYLTSKWMIGIYIFIGLICFLLIIGKKSVHSTISIKASPNQVWQVIINTSKYNEWNSVMNLLEGNIKEGSLVKYRFTQEAGRFYDIPSKVKKITPSSLLNQSGGTFGIITFNHKYILEEKEGKTVLTIHEDYHGVFVPFWNPEPVQKAYDRLNKDIKSRVESLY